jgi:two-component system response regulator CpxR
MNLELLLLSDHTHLSQDFLDELKAHDLKVEMHHIDMLHHEPQRAEPFAMVLFDMHHDMHKVLETIAKIRGFGHVGIIVITYSNHEKDCLDAFSAGTDDYIQKPLCLAECVARIKAVLRRYHTTPLDDAILTHGPLYLNCLTRQVLLKNEHLTLTNSEFNLLELFLRYPNRVLSKEQLTEYSLGRKYTAYDRSIDVHVSNLRHKLSEDHHDESWIQTIRGYGYACFAKY